MKLDFNDIPERHETAAAIARISARLRLETVDDLQDWAVECADPDILDAALLAYGDSELDEDDHFALMSLMLSSLELASQSHHTVSHYWEGISILLLEHPKLHAPQLAYWACPGEIDQHYMFAITARVRQLIEYDSM